MKEAQDLINDCEWESDGIQSTITFSNVEKLMIEFAKLHVEAALNKAYDDINPETGKYILSTRQTMLDSYPLTNIK